MTGRTRQCSATALRALTLVGALTASLGLGACPPIEIVAAPETSTPEPDATVEVDTGPVVVTCTFPDATPCDDGDSCTQDTCNSSGECVNEPKSNVCVIGGECYDFDQANPATACQYCDAANQTAWTEVVCEDDNPCTDNNCSAQDGCTYPANDALTCDDGDPCSTDDRCSAGECVGTCACTQDADCTDTVLDECEKAVCQDNVCVAVADDALDGEACSPEDPCLEGATCTAGICSGGAPKDCSSAADDCNAGTCDPTSGDCVKQAVVDGTPCDEGNECTTGSCTAGACDTTANVLQDCTPADSCVVNAKCTANAECKGTWDSGLAGCNCVDNTQCDDGIACTTETCTAGECIYELQFDQCLIDGQCYADGDPNPDNPCQSCDVAVSQSAWTLFTCPDDGDACTLETCNTTSGNCESEIAPGANCDDGDPCTENDLCDADGACAGSPNTCDDGNPCTADSCEAGTGTCINTITDGVACDAPCVVNGVCNAAGECTGTTLNCDDGNPCTIDDCDTSGGACVNTPDEGAACVADADPCTTDRCSATGVCQAQNLISNCVLYETEFDCGAGDWVTELLKGSVEWAVDNTLNPPGFWSANCSLNFNNDYEVLPNYFSPFSASAGTATGPVIDATDADSLYVSLYQYWDTQDLPSPNGGGADQRELRVSTDNFETFTSYRVDQLGHTQGNKKTWFLTSIDISEFAGESNVQLQFWFDTINQFGNNGAGWYVDNLTVSPAPASVPPENCGNSSDDDSDGLTDCDDPDCDSVCAKPGDTCGTALTLGPAPATVTGTMAGKDNSHNDYIQCPTQGVYPGGPEAVYQFTPSTTGNYRFTVSGVGQYPNFGILTDCQDGQNTCVAAAFGNFNGTATVTASLESGTTYFIRLEADWTPGGGGPFELSVELSDESSCTDGTDNDGDGAADCLDIECRNDPSCLPEFRCGDGLDDDGDGDIDCADSDCNCNENVCDDGIDDDLDGLTDCEDPNCNFFCLEGNNCGDNIDNDGDGFTDCGDVGDCGTAFNCQEQFNCSDDIDNDGDGSTDCDDADCDPTQCDEGNFCSDGLDNDNDALIDCDDADCASDPFCLETDNCNDYIDNDGDGAVDCNDSQCVGNFACVENCFDGVDNDTDGLIDCLDSDCNCTENNNYAFCHDGLDNDQDGSTDCNDPDCNNFCNEGFSNQCSNGLDDDGNGFTDCDDFACTGNNACDESLNCNDGKDNDGNGAIDCEDTAACGTQSQCDESINCTDGKDNDQDGQFDCADTECATHPSCQGTACTNDADCDDGDGCTFDNCSFGLCVYVQQGSNCCTEDTQCNDNNICTIDSCSTSGGGICQTEPVPASGVPNVMDYDFETPVGGLAFTNSAGTCGWQQADVGLSQSGDSVLYYGDPGVGTFACGGTNSGTAKTEGVTVPAGGLLGFWLRMDTEGSDFYDMLTVFAEVGGVQTLVWSKPPDIVTFEWIFVAVDLAAFEGQSVQIVFQFDTIDDIGNETLGVMIDDLIIGDACSVLAP